MRDQIQARAARLKRIEGKEASLRKLARDFAAALREELDDLEVSGSSRIALVPHPNGDRSVTIPAWLNYSDGGLVAVYQPGGTVVWPSQAHRGCRRSGAGCRSTSANRTGCGNCSIVT